LTLLVSIQKFDNVVKTEAHEAFYHAIGLTYI